MENPRLDSEKKEVGILLDVLSAHGITEFVCSPGSRNTPLLIGAQLRTEINITMVVDERTAGFIALGKSLVSQKPTVLICTSGTAPLNYAPALAEAFYVGIPLIAITADRPKEWIDQDDSQTIHQNDIFKNYIKRSYDIPTGRDDNEFLWYVNRIANEGILFACSGKQGPVHLNFRFATPLGNITNRQERTPRIINSVIPAPFLAKETMQELAQYAQGKRILLVAGFLPPQSRLQKSVATLSKFSNVSIMAETISNLHLEIENYSIDSSLCHLDKISLQKVAPDIIISIGGSLISRRLKEWLRSCTNSEHWMITEDYTVADCFKSLTKIIHTEPYAFIRQFSGALRRYQSKCNIEIPQYKKLWETIRKESAQLNEDYIKTCGWSDLKAFSIILPSIPSSWNLFLSNGTTIRYDQIIPHNIPHVTFCNRGVSGIDGCTSTAVGGATQYKGITLLITGDTSFSYDLGGLGCRLADNNFRMIVIRNGGGEIFRFISSTSSLPMRDECFCADSNPPVKGLAAAYGWDYLEAHSVESLLRALTLLKKDSEKPIILEVNTPEQENAEILRKYFRNQRINIK